MSEKKMLNVELASLGLYGVDGLISDIIVKLEESKNYWESEGYTDISLDVNYYGDEADINIVGRRIESDEEYEKRIEQEERQADNEKALYLRLKKKYENA